MAPLQMLHIVILTYILKVIKFMETYKYTISAEKVRGTKNAQVKFI